jgi:hypothetical protein
MGTAAPVPVMMAVVMMVAVVVMVMAVMVAVMPVVGLGSTCEGAAKRQCCPCNSGQKNALHAMDPFAR